MLFGQYGCFLTALYLAAEYLALDLLLDFFLLWSLPIPVPSPTPLRIYCAPKCAVSFIPVFPFLPAENSLTWGCCSASRFFFSRDFLRLVLRALAPEACS